MGPRSLRCNDAVSTSDGILYCRLVGGPLDGLTEEEWIGAQTIILNADHFLPSPERGNAWVIYKRRDPDVITADGLTEFHYSATRENPAQ